MNAINKKDGRPIRVVRLEGQDIAVHVGSFDSDDKTGDSLDLSLYPTARVGNNEPELPSEALQAVVSLRRVLRTQLETRSRALMLTMNSLGNSKPQGTGTAYIGTRENLEGVLGDILDDVDQFPFKAKEEHEKNRPLYATAKRLMASAMEDVDLDFPMEGNKNISNSTYYRAIGSITADGGVTIEALRTAIDELMHLGNLEGRIIDLVEENGKFWLRMNLTVPSGRVLKAKILEKKWKEAQ